MQRSPKTIALAYINHVKPNGIEAVNSAITELGLIAESVRCLKLASFFKNPSFTFEKKEEWIRKIAGALKISSETQNLAVTLLKINQINSINKVVTCMKELRLEQFGVGEGCVTTVTPLTTEQKDAVNDLIKKIGKFKEAIIIENTNPNLLGGIAVSAGDRLVDATIKRQLKNILKLVS